MNAERCLSFRSISEMRLVFRSSENEVLGRKTAVAAAMIFSCLFENKVLRSLFQPMRLLTSMNQASMSLTEVFVRRAISFLRFLEGYGLWRFARSQSRDGFI